jgi:hypothetical protein
MLISAATGLPCSLRCTPRRQSVVLLLWQVLVNDRLYDKGGLFYDRARDIVGDGLVTCPYKDHRRQRRLLQPAFTRTLYSTPIDEDLAQRVEQASEAVLKGLFRQMILPRFAQRLPTPGNRLPAASPAAADHRSGSECRPDGLR